MVAETFFLSSDLRDRVLAKMGLSERPSVDLDGLSNAYRAWCRNIPFDNARKLIHVKSNNSAPLPGGDATDFFESWLRHGTGGTCWAGNGALYAFLSSLGFQTSRGIATMLVAPNLPPNHATVFVDVDGSEYLVDASMLFSEPLLTKEGIDTTNTEPAWGVKTSKRDGKIHILWRPGNFPSGLECRLDTKGASAEDYRTRHEATRYWSPFNYEHTMRRIIGDTVVGLNNGKRVEFGPSGEPVVRVLNDADRHEFLIKEMKLSPEIVKQIPRDCPTPPPPGSKSAQAMTES